MFCEPRARIIDDGVGMVEERTIFAEIEAVLADEGEPRLERLEHTLTSGYAAALGLEAQCWRLEQRIADAAGELAGDAADERRAEIAALARDRSGVVAELARLRELLGRLRDRALAARAESVRA